MQFHLNGESTALAESCTLETFLTQQALNQPGTAVAINQQVIPRSLWSETFIRDNDDVDVFRAIAGG